MKKRKRRGVILVCKRHLCESVSGGPGELALAVVVQHFLEIGASARSAIEISIAFAKREVSVRTACASRIIVEILLIFRSRQIVTLASEQTVCVLKLPLNGRLLVARPRRRKFFLSSGDAA